MRVSLPGGGPNVTGICDRVDESKDGELMIIDYKTGKASFDFDSARLGALRGRRMEGVGSYIHINPIHPSPTGKAPNLKYSDAVNQRIVNDKFFQLKVCYVYL